MVVFPNNPWDRAKDFVIFAAGAVMGAVMSAVSSKDLLESIKDDIFSNRQAEDNPDKDKEKKEE